MASSSSPISTSIHTVPEVPCFPPITESQSNKEINETVSKYFQTNYPLMQSVQEIAMKLSMETQQVSNERRIFEHLLPTDSEGAAEIYEQKAESCIVIARKILPLLQRATGNWQVFTTELGHLEEKNRHLNSCYVRALALGITLNPLLNLADPSKLPSPLANFGESLLTLRSIGRESPLSPRTNGASPSSKVRRNSPQPGSLREFPHLPSSRKTPDAESLRSPSSPPGSSEKEGVRRPIPRKFSSSTKTTWGPADFSAQHAWKTVPSRRRAHSSGDFSSSNTTT